MGLIPGLPDDIARECLIRVPYTSFSTAMAACKHWKEEIESKEFPLLRRSNGHSQFVFVVAQARMVPARAPGCPMLPDALSYSLSAFDPVSGNWWEFPPLPDCTDGIPMFCQLAAVGSDLVVVGGLDPITWESSGSVYIYSFVFGEWRRGAEMPGVRRSFFACTSDGQGMVFVAGGHDGEKNALRSAVAYDMSADRWLAMPDMAEERDECKAMFRRGSFLVLGGYPTESQGRFVKSVEEFNVAAWRWCSERDNVPESIGVNNVSLYMCRHGDVSADVSHPSRATTCQGELMVIGSARSCEPHMGYLLEANNINSLNCKFTWSRVEFDERFLGHAHSGCILEI